MPSVDNCMPGPERMPMLLLEAMDEPQRAAADALIAGPRGAVFGPFIPLLRSPALLERLKKVGEYLRFDSVLDASVTEFAILVVSRHWSQQFEWCMHYPLALQAGVPAAVLDAVAEGRLPTGMTAQEAVVHGFCTELLHHHGVADLTYDAAVAQLGEQGVVELLGLIGYFCTMAVILNVARTPPLANSTAAPLIPFPR